MSNMPPHVVQGNKETTAQKATHRQKESIGAVSWAFPSKQENSIDQLYGAST